MFLVKFLIKSTAFLGLDKASDTIILKISMHVGWLTSGGFTDIYLWYLYLWTPEIEF